MPGTNKKGEQMVNRNSRLLISARFITRFGDQIDSLAFAWIMYSLTNSPMMMGVVLALNALPSVLFGYFTGGIIDKISKKKLIIFSGLGRMTLVCVLLSLYITKMLTPIHLFVLSFVVSIFELVEFPSVSSLIPEIVEEKDTMTVVSSLKTMGTVASVTGSAAAAFLMATFGIVSMVVVDILTFALCVIIIGFMRVQKSKATHSDDGQKIVALPEKTMKDAFIYVFKHKMLLFMILFIPLINFLLAPYGVFSPIYANEIVKTGPIGMSLMSGFFSGGLFFGGIFMAKKGDGINWKKIMTTGIVFSALFYFGLGSPVFLSFPSINFYVLILPVCVLAGFGIQMLSVILQTYILKLAPKDSVGKVMTICAMFGDSSLPLSFCLSGILGEYFAIDKIFLVIGMLLFLGVFITRKLMKNLDVVQEAA